MKRSIIFCIGIAMVFLTGLSKVSFAQLLVEEGKIKKIIAPGQTVADTVTLHNSTDKPIDVIVYLEDFEYVPPFDGSKKFYPAGTVARSAADWVSFSPKEINLPAYAKKKINYTINVPKDASGGYYGVLFFERTDRQTITDGQVGIQIVARVGSLLFVETDNRDARIDLKDIVLKDGALHAKLINQGNVNLVLKCLYYVMDSDGVPVDRGESETSYMAPGGQKDFSISLGNQLSSGKYTAILTFDLEDGISSVHEIDLTVDSNQKIEMTGYRK